MRILYDGKIYSMHRAGGIIRYFSNIINRLPDVYTPIVTTCRSGSISPTCHPKLNVIQYFPFRPSRISWQIEKWFFKSSVYFNSFDVVHPTYYEVLSRSDLNSLTVPVVITVHDMIHERYSEQLDSTGEHAELKRQAICAAQAIICVSQNTKKDLLERYDIPDDRITVTYLASELDASLSHGDEMVPTQPYFLYIGSRAQYKNFDTLLVAFSKAVSCNSEIKLCVVGSPFNNAEQQLIRSLGVGELIEHYSFVNDRHLAKLYHCSIAFVYPSLYEGFGIPPLEAMACETVAVTSNTSSLPEVVGDAGIMFNPDSPNDLADILLDLIDRPTERDRLIQKGVERSQLFSWDKTVAQTLEVYSSVVT